MLILSYFYNNRFKYNYRYTNFDISNRNNKIEYEYKKDVNTIKVPKYGMDKEIFQGQKLFNTCLVIF